MIFRFFKFLYLMLPYWVIIQFYKKDKALPANIKTRSGQNLKAIMITEKYGILFTENEYVKNRVKFLRKQQEWVNQVNQSIAEELNSFSWEAKEAFFEEEQ